MTDLLALGLVVPLVIDWLTVVVILRIEHRNPGIRALVDRRWLSFAAAIGSTLFATLAIAHFVKIDIDTALATVLLVLPTYLFSAINVVFLYLTWQGKW